MRKIFINTLSLIIAVLLVSPVMAGNEQRAGSNGASELLINPWARSSGWGDSNVACVVGLEGLYQNIAGLAFTNKTELIFTNTQWLVGSGISINSFGIAQTVGEAGVLSLGVMAMNFGEIPITTPDLPEGGIGNFSPSYTNITLAYAREFSNSIYGGIGVKIINEGIANATASGFAIDAGIQYVTGLGVDKAGNRKRENLRFGISMKNVGTTMKFKGDGMSFTGILPNESSMTVEHRSQDFELPSLIKIGFSYHMNLDAKVDSVSDEVVSNHKLSIAFNFTANSFTKDQFHLGLEYSFMNLFSLRGGYIYEKGITSPSETTSVFKGPAAGVSVHIPMNKESKSVIAIDYSYRATYQFDGVHTIGARVTL